MKSIGNLVRKDLNTVLVKPAGPDCNLNCRYCFYTQKHKLFPATSTFRMNDQILEELIRQAMQQGGRQMTFAWQGGEPTLMGLPFYEKVVNLQQKYGRDQIVGNGLQTNATLLDKNWAFFLRRYKFLVGISLDGPAHIHNQYRVGQKGFGSWQQVVDKTKLMLDCGVDINALTVVTDYSVRFPDEIYSFHKSLGIYHMQFIPCIEKVPGESNQPATFSVSAAEFGKFLCRLFDLWYGDFQNGQPTTSIRFFDSVLHRYMGLPSSECSLMDRCGVYLVIEHNGDVYPCDFFVEPRWHLGNIMEKRLMDMLNSQHQNSFGEIKAALNKSCGGCKWLHFCGGGCVREHMGDFLSQQNTPNYLCESYKTFFEYANERLKLISNRASARSIIPSEINPCSPVSKTKLRKIGRNEPCPCGSGKKYKKCCFTGL